MSGFVKTLESYVNGALSRDELFREVDRLLSHDADPSTLLASLYDEHARARLPGTLHGELVRKLLRHSAGPDLSRAWARTGLAVLPAQPNDDAATIVSDETGSGVTKY